METHAHVVSWIIAGFFVVFHSYHRFGTPPRNRASTTQYRYYVVLAVYLFAAVASYSLIALSPEFMHDVMPPALGDLFSETALRVGAPFFGALFVTVLLPALPGLSEPEEWLRDVLHDLAAIPYEAVRLSKRLLHADLNLSDETRGEVTEAMRRDGIDAEHIVFANNRGLDAIWTRICSLMHVLREWNDDRRLVAFRRAFRADYNDLLERHHHLTGVFTGFCALAAVNDDRFGAALHGLESRVGAETEALLKDICEFIAMGVLRCRMTDATRSFELRRLGFNVSVPKHRGDLFNKGVALSLLLAAYFTVVMALTARDLPINSRLLLGLSITAIYDAAVLCAVYATRRGYDPGDGERPWSKYAAAALVAAILSIMTNFGMATILNRSITQAADGLRITFPWSFLALVTAMATCFNCHNGSKVRRLRWIEAIGQAVVTMATGAFVWWLLNALKEDLAAPVVVPPWWRVVANCLVAGSLIGFNVPTWVRKHRTIIAAEERPEPGDDTSARVHTRVRAA